MNYLGELEPPRSARPTLSIKDLDARVSHLQNHALEKSTVGGYSTGAHDYIRFCILHKILIDPTPETLSHYIAFTSLSIASRPKYLTGARHYLLELFPEFDNNRASHQVQATIRGSKKVRADPVHRKQPIRTDLLAAFLAKARCSLDYDDLLFATIMSCCFYGCHRSGELVLKTKRTSTGERSLNILLFALLTVMLVIVFLIIRQIPSFEGPTFYFLPKMLWTPSRFYENMYRPET